MPRIPATERRAALARAALVVASRDGLAAASTRAIVAEAGMPLASFHYAVASRDELLRDVVALVVAGEGAAALAPLVAHARDPREAIRLALLGYLDLVRADPGREQAMFELTQHALRTPGLADLPREQYARYRETAHDVLVAGARHLGFGWRVPPDDLARLLVVITDGLTLAWLADRDDAAAERAVDLAVEALVGFADSPVPADPGTGPS